MKPVTVPKEDIYNYYIVENHTYEEAREHFNLTNHAFYKMLHHYDIKKPTSNDFKKLYTKEDIYKYFVEENHTYEEALNHFNVTSDILAQTLRDYKINKSEEMAKRLADKTERILSTIDKELLFDLYITKDKSRKEICDLFDITEPDFNRLVKAHDIKKISPPKYPAISIDELLIEVPKERLVNDFVTRNLSKEQLSNEYNICQNKIDYLISHYNITKPLHLISELANKSKLSNSGTMGNAAQFNKYTDEFKEMYYDYDKSKAFLDVMPRYKARDLNDRFNCPVTTVFYWTKKLGLRDYIVNEVSHYENEIAEYLRSLIPDIKIKVKYRKAFKGKSEIDVYLPDYKLGIEFNGTYWHSDAVIPDRQYHLKKSKLAEKYGIHLIHIYEYEWTNPQKQQLIKTLLQLHLQIIPQRIYARKCKIRPITNKEAKEFNNLNHLQGHRYAQITYGLFYNEELVQLMSFSKTKYNKNLKGDNSWEIIRGCPGSNNIVIGGVSKLFSHFVKNHLPDSVFSYCDFNKFTGVSYEKLNMEFIGYTGPDKKYVINDMVFNRNPSKYHEYKAKAQYCIYGAGSKKYMWYNPSLKHQLIV